MARHAPDEDLPDGVVKLPRQEQGAGCGLRGCLYGVVALFAVLLLVMVGVALLRQWQTPVIPH